MSEPLQRARLVVVAPRVGVGGVGDYSQDVIDAVAPFVGEVVEHRTGMPGEDTVADLRRLRTEVARSVEEAPGPVVVHTELSGGAVAGFWGTAGLPRHVPVTATVHDPPHPIWWPARTRFLTHHRMLNHAVHFPLRPVSHRVQRRHLRAQTLFVLTRSGARSIGPLYPDVDVVEVPHVVARRPDIAPPQDRPRAVGFFGLVYRGKGFEQLEHLRRLLDPDIAIRVAGRGTESLPPIDGVDIVGGVDGADEDAFFASIRVLVMPYGRRSPYGMGYPASGVMARAVAYGTPVVCTDHGALADHGDGDGVTVLRDAPEEPEQLATVVAAAVTALVDDPDRLRTAGEQVQRVRREASHEAVARTFRDTWTRLLESGR
ncbi:glycosyltransferase [Williamsia deligens]|uniref:Glycosyltransferase n=1 Tax=Williamsia deligens TaxID=321325 RepID=A0ABW3G8E8_9NOCA|nr:glycosyltransferase [Williamsia deligens]MCP2195739.1 Glycosyltransferase involved in cell wall bisynthesis [Williamsia deligens]